jgi:hypothetical protein
MQIAKGCSDSLSRWITRGSPHTGNTHIELCRKEIVSDKNEMMCVNLNQNLYKKYEGKIYSKGNEFDENTYVHLKYRDLRIEMSEKEFAEFADMIGEAYIKLKLGYEETHG